MGTLDRLKADLLALKNQDLTRSLKLKTGLIDFSSNDYLGLRTNAALIRKIQGVAIDALGSGGSRLLSGNSLEMEKLEKLLAKTHNQESALVYNSGYTANLGFFSAIPGRNSVVIYDEKVHVCIKDGMRLSLAKKIAFKHNDLVQLEKRLTTEATEKFVVVESIYSMDGDEAPLVEIATLCQKYNAHLVVDEAHSTGVYGKKGAGLVTQLNLDAKVFAKINTFGKAIGAHGACIVSNEYVKQYLINHSRPFIFTTAMPYHAIVTLLEIYGYLSCHWEELQQQIQSKINLFKSMIATEESLSNSPIQIVMVPGNKEVKNASKKLENEGFDVRPVMSPTVPKGEERLRVCLHTYNTDEEIIRLANVINKLR